MCIDCVRVSRRNFMSLAASGVATAGIWAVSGKLSPGLAATNLTSDESLARLKAGNERFVNGSELCEERLRDGRAHTAETSRHGRRF